ncbi:MAG: ice-binding family protein [Solirubrobacteraceae bacterium]|nr:ice-binding family protein [Solirubrobacteraceae bacterium]
MDEYVISRTRIRGRVGRALGITALTLALAPAFAANAFAGPGAVLLGTAGDYAVLGGSGLTNTGVSTIEGDVGSSPTHSQTGFEPCPAADCISLTGTNHDVADPNDAETQQAKDDLSTAYLDALGRTGGSAISAPLGGGTTLVSGVYTSAADLFVGGDLTLDAGGDPNAVFIFQAQTGSLTTAAGSSSGIPNTRVLLTNGAQGCNVFWQVGSSATIGTYTQFVGNVLANQSITVNTAATVDSGRVLARNGAVTLDNNTIKATACATPPGDPDPGGDTDTGGGTTTPSTPTPVASPPPFFVALPAVPTATTVAAPAAAQPGRSTLTGPRRPVRGPFTVTVTGRRIDRVVFYVDGKWRKTVRATAGRTKFTLRIDPRRQSRRVHRVTARVRYATASRTRDSSLRLLYRRPALTPRSPSFTG